MQITVFLASSLGTDPRMRAALEELAVWIGRAGHTLVYGGSRIGLMGVLAVTAKENGARVIGVEPRFFVEACRQFEGADELIVTETMSERKDKLIAMADAVVVFPGGAGTLEEFSQTLSMLNLGHADLRLVVYDVNGFWAPLGALLRDMVQAGFLSGETLERVVFAKSLAEVAEAVDGGRG